MTYPDFLARAELYLGSDWPTAVEQGPRSFRTAAQAIHFAVEEAAPVSLHGAQLRIGDLAYSGEQIKGLYWSPDYPLARKRATDAATRTRRRALPKKGLLDREPVQFQLRRHGRAFPEPALRKIASDPVSALRQSL